MSKSPFLQSVRTEIRTKQYSYRTEKTYLYWVRQFILFNDKRHPKVMGNHKIERFLNHLAVNRGVSPATQNQALCAIIFLYKNVLKIAEKGDRKPALQDVENAPAHAHSSQPRRSRFYSREYGS